MNAKMKISAVERIARQKTGKRIDMLFRYDSYEIGVYEAKRFSREYSDEGIAGQ